MFKSPMHTRHRHGTWYLLIKVQHLPLIFQPINASFQYIRYRYHYIPYWTPVPSNRATSSCFRHKLIFFSKTKFSKVPVRYGFFAATILRLIGAREVYLPTEFMHWYQSHLPRFRWGEMCLRTNVHVIRNMRA